MNCTGTGSKWLVRSLLRTQTFAEYVPAVRSAALSVTLTIDVAAGTVVPDDRSNEIHGTVAGLAQTPADVAIENAQVSEGSDA